MSEANPLRIGWVSSQKPTSCPPYSCNSIIPQAMEGHGFAPLKVDCHLERCSGTQVTYSEEEGKQTSHLEPGSLNLVSGLWGRWLCCYVRVLRCIINMSSFRLKTHLGTQPTCSLQLSVWPPAATVTGELQQRHSSWSSSRLLNPPAQFGGTFHSPDLSSSRSSCLGLPLWCCPWCSLSFWSLPFPPGSVPAVYF